MTPQTTPPASGALLGGDAPASGGIVLATATEAQKAAQLWAEAQRTRKQPCTMPPWDENQYALNPQCYSYSLLQGVSQQVAKPDPQRVALIFTPRFAGSYVIIIRPGGSVDPNNITGIGIFPGAQPFVVQQRELLNLASVEWDAIAEGGNTTLLVVEVTLRNWSK